MGQLQRPEQELQPGHQVKQVPGVEQVLQHRVKQGHQAEQGLYHKLLLRQLL